MDSKMSVGLDTSISIGLSGQPWIPTPSPTLKLSTPTLEPLQVENPEGWNNPLTGNNSALPQSSSNPLNLSTGLTPRFSPGFGAPLASPGVSGEIANVPDNSIPNTSLSDLFRCSEYPFTSSAPPSAPISARPPSSRQPFRHPQPTTPNGAQPISVSASHHAHQKNGPVMSPPKPVTSQPYMSAFSRPSAQQLPPPTQPLAYNSQQANTQQHMASAPPHSTYGYPVVTNSVPQALHNRGLAGVLQGAGAQSQSTQPLMSANAADNQVAQPKSMIPGHRSKLGSGIVSNAVEEAQVRARIKAESFAKSRKRKKTDTPQIEPPEKLTEEDAKLSPEDLKKKRYQRRLALNRESAAVSRVRRREYVKLLEEQLVSAEEERVTLATQLADMRKDHQKMKEYLQNLEEQIGENADN